MNPDNQTLIEQLNIISTYEKKRVTTTLALEQNLKEDFPNLENLYISTDSIEIRTKHHTLRYSYWGDGWKTKIKFVCDGNQQMPDTVEEFKAIKDSIQDDKNQCMKISWRIANKIIWNRV